MIENGSIIELSNSKKYIITDKTIEDGNVFYLCLELDYETEEPIDETYFFKQDSTKSLIPITNQSDIDFLKNIFVSKFLSENNN